MTDTEIEKKIRALAQAVAILAYAWAGSTVVLLCLIVFWRRS